MEKIIFFFPWKEVSGGPFYLSRLANDLALNNNYEVYYVDYKNGLTEKLLSTQVKRIIYYEPFNLIKDSPVTIITPIYCASHIPKLHKDSKIVFINWHNYCVQALIDIWRLSEKELQEYLQLLHNTESIFFLDKTHWMAQNKWVTGNYTFSERYVPVTVQKSTTRALDSLVNDEINIAVLGRLCKDKIYSVLNLLNQLDNIKTFKNKNLFIIGDGEYKYLIENQLSTCNVNIFFLGTITGENLRIFLAKKIDILFSMGMSVLEGAVIGLPSVIIPHNIVSFNSDRFVYIHNSICYAVGWYDTQISDLGLSTVSLSEILADVYEKNRKKELGEKALQYVVKNHMSNIRAFQNAIEVSNLSYRDFWKYAKKRKRIKIFGVPIVKIDSSFDEHEKKITFLGIPSIIKYYSEGEKKEIFLFGKKIDWLNVKKENGKYRIYIRVPILKI